MVFGVADLRSSRRPMPGLNRFTSLGLVAISGLFLANCAQEQVSRSRSKEIGAFSHPKYGAASPRVVADGQDVPKGGGREMVGRSYTVAGKRYTPYEKPAGYTQVGMASWYGEAFHGRRTANGEIYDRHGVSAAHPTMPLPSYARVTNTLNGRSIIVRVNDRGPYHGGRIVDLSQKTADALSFRHLGTARVKVEYLGRASLRGSDDAKLIATLRTDGSPATLPGSSAPVMVASAEPVAPQRATPSAIARSVDLDGDGVPDSQQTTTIVREPAPAAPVATAAPLASAAPANALAMAPLEGARPVAGAPVPPQRPYDLATIPNAATPISTAVPGAQIIRTPQRAVAAGLFYAPPQAPKMRFAKGDPMAGLTEQRFVPLARR